MTTEETLNRLLNEHCSLSRFGDGELKQSLINRGISFQPSSHQLQSRLRTILNKPINDHLICLPHALSDQRNMTSLASSFWKQFDLRYRFRLFLNFPLFRRSKKQIFGDALCTRPYMDYIEHEQCHSIYETWKRVWQDRDMVIIEGEYSRLGVGSDLFDNARSIKRIIAPAINAFAQYDNIIETFRQLFPTPSKNMPVLISLGPAASVMAYDLAQLGYWAIDIGHIDIEYIWFKMGAKKKLPIPGRQVAEIGNLTITQDIVLPVSYTESIISRILE